MIEKYIGDSLYYIISSTEYSTSILLFFIMGVFVTGTICWIFYWCNYVVKKRTEYIKTLTDKEYRKYIEYRRSL
jgi:hypothetical protein